MTRPIIKLHDLATNEVIEREMTAAEYKEYENSTSYYAVKQAEAEAKAAQRQALLSRLGITEEEARILLGGN
jgi:hypothetical protein